MVIVLFVRKGFIFFTKTICVLALIVHILNVIITLQHDLVCYTYIFMLYICFFSHTLGHTAGLTQSLWWRAEVQRATL